MTQEDFAAAIGATVTTVNRSEQGRSAPSRLLCLAIRAFAAKRRITIPETT
jgi:DNA-binding XRE family transcriptional regulator